MDVKYSTSQQYQPLRVPQSFDKYGRVLVRQIEDVFDDIYRRFGRLKTTDLGKELRDLILIKDDNGNYVSIATTIQGIQTDIHDQLGNYYTKSETASKISQELGDALGNYYTKSETATQISTTMTTALGNYYTKTETASKITQDIGDALGNDYTKSETATQISTSMATALGDYYTKSETATQITTSMTTALGNYYTKTETASKISTDLSSALGSYSTTQQTAAAISAAVGDCYGKVSGVTINSSGVEISGSKYVKIMSGGSFQTQSGNFKIDTSGNVEIVGSLKAGSTFAGTMSANCITSGTMSADRISGGTIDATNVTIKKLNASNITSGTLSADYISGGTINGNNVTITNLSANNITGGTMSANRISGGSIDASNVTITNLNANNISSGTMSASKISGGTLTLGGNNNVNGTLIIQNASGTQIGKWDKDGISATSGSFSGDITGATGTFKGNLEAADGTFKVDSSNKKINAASWTFDSNGVTYDLGGSQVGKFAMGQNADREHVSDLRNAIKIGQNYLTILSPSSATWTQALNQICVGYYNSNEIGIIPVSSGMDLGTGTHKWEHVVAKYGSFTDAYADHFYVGNNACIHAGNIGQQAVASAGYATEAGYAASAGSASSATNAGYATSAGSAPDSTARANASDAQSRCGTLEGKTSMIIGTFGGFSTNARFYIPLINGGARVFAGIDKDFTAFYLRAGTLKHSGLPDGFTASLVWSDAQSRYEILVQRTNGNEFHCGGIAFTI